ncbi:MAG: sulfite exporter TauE/SafE family protein [Alphaproteobacteria bacterium]|nr:sulfite exporter TauE/SafE family protein [Alphaproteobacteria bacterium]
MLTATLEGIPLTNALLLCAGIFAVTFFVAAIGSTGGVQLAPVTFTLPAPLAIPMHAWITGWAAVFRGWTLRMAIDWPYLAWFEPLSVAASTAAIFITERLPLAWFELIIGGWILGSTVMGFVARRPSVVGGMTHPALLGPTTGFLSVFVGATGPLVFALLANRYDRKEEVQATHAACMTLQHLSKIVLFGIAGSAIFAYQLLMAATIAAAFAGTRLGSRVLLRMDEKLYRRLLAVVMLAVGAFIVVRAWLALRGG